MIRRFLLWFAFNVPYVPFRPFLIGIAIGRKPHRMTQEEEDRLEEKLRNAKVDGALEGNK